MLTCVTLSVERGPQVGAGFRLMVPSSCIIGRSSDCDIAVIGDPDPRTMSRHHCRLDVTPMGVRICDLGSRNGTYINGELVGQPHAHPASEYDWWRNDGEVVADGDVISFGGVRLRVLMEVEVPECVPVTERPSVNAFCLIHAGATPW